MKKSKERRFVGLDVHKQSIMVGALNERQEIVLSPRRVSLVKFEGWAARNLRPSDEVVLEATTNAWYIHDLLKPQVSRVVVANPHKVKLIAASFVKTDKKDTLTLARLLAVNLIPEVWVPPTQVRELRGLTAHRQKLIKQRTAARNRLHAILHRHHLLPPQTGLFSQESRAWWEELPLTRTEKLRARHDLSLLDYLDPLIAEVDTELAELSVADTWADQSPFLIQLPGIGLISAMTILGAIGDIERFPSAKKLVGYSGLGARIYASGDKQRSGGITKQGRRDLRRVLNPPGSPLTLIPTGKRNSKPSLLASANPKPSSLSPASCLSSSDTSSRLKSLIATPARKPSLALSCCGGAIIAWLIAST